LSDVVVIPAPALTPIAVSLEPLVNEASAPFPTLTILRPFVASFPEFEPKKTALLPLYEDPADAPIITLATPFDMFLPAERPIEILLDPDVTELPAPDPINIFKSPVETRTPGAGEVSVSWPIIILLELFDVAAAPIVSAPIKTFLVSPLTPAFDER
jgi:hypothetical protein